ncbi:tubulin binding cofactor A [Rozella allomycis CSF55]|uniref:Tubulin-specific chaperone A n=1 Tax=Rozella allomycis (strain CSF55) TaxID=988480 RepID=A0A069C7X4_ROZAC|nr:Tubulin binding cofactor A domain-containing protein [Rozella allomycis CSF55]EPZ36478.1 Tubulin binding cofactor A domain-containing protein [Rozella allomycis CSF55]RKP18650.1 tubulin binding cofactor A [Rozella allomycis CSF55]|eukprot:EPZ36342.1 Tubulin binding cofactor A domain-containing protein [Rozella allomycis CSF55]
MSSLKTLSVTSGTVKRIMKDITSYEKEYKIQSAKIDKMKMENKDAYDIKKQIEVLEETEKMIPDCKKRLERALADLNNLLKNVDGSWEGTEELSNARTIQQEAMTINL